MTNNLTINQIEAIRSLKTELMAQNSRCSSFFEKAVEESSKSTVNVPAREIKTGSTQKNIGIGSTACILVGGVGLAIGLMTKNKDLLSYLSIGLMTIGVGGVIYSRKNHKDSIKNPMDKNSDSILDFDKLNSFLYSYISKVIKSINQRWNDCINENRKTLTEEILSSNYTESDKSDLLAKATVAAIPSITISDYSLPLEQLCSTKDEEGLRNFMDKFRKDADREVERLYDEQLQIYEEINKTKNI